MEPLNLKCWEIGVEPTSGLTFFTCARPGRSLGPDNRVPDDVVSHGQVGRWARITECQTTSFPLGSKDCLVPIQ